MSIVARADGAWRLIDCKENSGVYVRDAGEWISLCPEIEREVLPPFELIRTVEFTNSSKIDVDDVFKHPDDGGFNNYVISMRFVNTLGNSQIKARLRDNLGEALGRDYTSQLLNTDGNGTAPVVPSGERHEAETEFRVAYSSELLRGGAQVYFYGPALPTPTAMRSSGVRGTKNASLNDIAGTHSLPLPYHSITFFPASGAETGSLSVYGVRS